MAKLIENEQTKALEYADTIVKLIREKYSLNEELAILRQRDTKPEEFKTYNDYVEECKVKAKSIIGS